MTKFSFEVKETDLFGRIGKIGIRGKDVETPYLFPVVHPIEQAVPITELASMGFNGVMTNSYILKSRRREEALERGVHGLLGQDGVVMTDSGGYQVLQYGDLQEGYREMASFQADIGTEFAVTLDRPTGYPQERGVARDTVDYSLKNALMTLEEFGHKETVWVGPVQGGLHLDLVRRSAREMEKAGFEFLALGSPTRVMENYMFADLVRMIVAVRKSVRYSMPLHLFGAGHPLTMSLAVALGCDTFDSASYILFARDGRYMAHDGILNLQTMKYLPCSCPVCSKTTVGELQELDLKEKTYRLALHNLHILRETIETCKEAITEGRLWDLVERDSFAHPRLRQAFVELSRNSTMLAKGTASLKDRGLFLKSGEDFRRPEIELAGRRLKGVMKRNSSSALVLPAHGAQVSTRTKRQTRAKKGEDADVYGVHEALGVYPIELEFVYPFSQTVASETQGGAKFRQALGVLRKRGYSRVGVGVQEKIRSRRTRREASPSARSS